MTHRTKSNLLLLFIYIMSFTLGYWAGGFVPGEILLQSAVAVVIAVTVIFAGSFFFNNSSVFDPYWSLAPPIMMMFYFTGILQIASLIPYPGSHIPDPSSRIPDLLFSSPRILILFLLTLAYSIRLTWNFLRGWPGLNHEDWRYVDFRKFTGRFYWVVSFFGIHLFPALMVFGGTLSIWVVVVHCSGTMNFLDILAILVTGYAIFLETAADRQLRNFMLQNKESGKTLNQGLWGLSRHPNYLGEILFWWGLYLFALAANPDFWWVITGPVAITLMFIFASIPMIEKRMMKRQKDYETYKEMVSMLVPWKIKINR